MIIRKNTYREPINEASMLNALNSTFYGGYKKFHNFFYSNHEADLFAVSEKMYATEVEVKCSLYDWQTDLRKSKHRNISPYIKYFYFAVPTSLINDQPEGFNEKYGLIEVYHEKDGVLWSRIIKPATILNNLKIPDELYQKALVSTYHKYHQSRMMIRELKSRIEGMKNDNNI